MRTITRDSRCIKTNLNFISVSDAESTRESMAAAYRSDKRTYAIVEIVAVILAAYQRVDRFIFFEDVEAQDFTLEQHS